MVSKRKAKKKQLAKGNGPKGHPGIYPERKRIINGLGQKEYISPKITTKQRSTARKAHRKADQEFLKEHHKHNVITSPKARRHAKIKKAPWANKRHKTYGKKTGQGK